MVATRQTDRYDGSFAIFLIALYGARKCVAFTRGEKNGRSENCLDDARNWLRRISERQTLRDVTHVLYRADTGDRDRFDV